MVMLLSKYNLPLADLSAMADKIRRDHTGNALETCTILNAKSGRCSEDCKFCAQSVHYQTDAPVYGLMSKREIVESALIARDAGSSRFSIVTSGHRLSADDVARVAEAAAEIRCRADIGVCVSLGSLKSDMMCLLKDAGVSRYHHNIETSREFFPAIVGSHTFDERIATIKNAVEAGLSICSGGILGMGESRADRVSMALTLRELNVDSVPINILMPIDGTSLAGMSPLSVGEVLKTIAIFRIALPDKTIRLAAGRESHLRDFQGMAFMSGANAMMIGGYLTKRGRPVEEDKKLVEEIRRAWTE
ncbi:MAG: biotin synthase BioB [Syntrophaceae bacterium]|nr:biotin synthase BioB [Syntrophaceae bacterium]